MELFTGWQYLLIDVANQYGLDKLLFNERIKWVEEHLDQLESLADQAETKPLYLKGVQAIRKAQKGIATGHVVGFDGCCSGIQIMSAVTGCVAGATATGLVDPNVRADAYTTTAEVMNDILGGGVDVSRKDAKRSLMTSFYGSKKVPIAVFGEDTPELTAFYQAAHKVAPGAWELLQDLLGSWQPYALCHSWKLPDGYDAKVKVMTKREVRIEVDELDHATFTYTFHENAGKDKGLSNAANVVHSLDAYVLRCMHRRCNYDRAMVLEAHSALQSEKELRDMGIVGETPECPEGQLGYYIQQYQRSGIADVVILPLLKDGTDTQYLSADHITKLVEIAGGMLEYQPFEIITIHDEFKCCPNNCNALRQQYINILADLADSDILSDIFSQLHGVKGKYPKLSNNLGAMIRVSNYALS